MKGRTPWSIRTYLVILWRNIGRREMGHHLTQAFAKGHFITEPFLFGRNQNGVF